MVMVLNGEGAVVLGLICGADGEVEGVDAKMEL